MSFSVLAHGAAYSHGDLSRCVSACPIMPRDAMESVDVSSNIIVATNSNAHQRATVVERGPTFSVGYGEPSGTDYRGDLVQTPRSLSSCYQHGVMIAMYFFVVPQMLPASGAFFIPASCRGSTGEHLLPQRIVSKPVPKPNGTATDYRRQNDSGADTR